VPQVVRQVLVRGGVLFRRVAATLIAGLWPGRDLRDVDDTLATRPPRQQTAIIAGVLLCLGLTGFFAAQFGWIGILIFWMAVILIAR
jgi:hypothetical protein